MLLFSKPIQEQLLCSQPIKEQLLFSRPIKKQLIFSPPGKEELLFSRPIKKKNPFPLFQSKKYCHSPLKEKLLSKPRPLRLLDNQLPSVVGTPSHRPSSIIKSFVFVHPYFSCTTSIPTNRKKSCMKNRKEGISVVLIFSTNKVRIILSLTYQCRPKGLLILFSRH